MPSAPTSRSPCQELAMPPAAPMKLAVTPWSSCSKPTSRCPRWIRCVAEPLLDGAVEQALQPATVDRELRPGIARLEPARLCPDPLPELIAVDQLPGSYAGGVELFEQAEFGQLLDRMRQQVDADAELADLGRLLEELDLDLPLGQAERRCQAADAAAASRVPASPSLTAKPGDRCRGYAFRPRHARLVTTPIGQSLRPSRAAQSCARLEGRGDSSGGRAWWT